MQLDSKKSELDAWHQFEQSGSITDYINYKNTAAPALKQMEEVPLHANQNTGDHTKTAQYR